MTPSWLTIEKMHSIFLVVYPRMNDFEDARDDMKFPGYWVSTIEGKVLLERTTFDETELDPATNWKHAWQNQDVKSQINGYVDLDAALISAAKSLARSTGLTLNQTDLDKVICFDPAWDSNRCEIKSLSQLLDSNIDL